LTRALFKATTDKVASKPIIAITTNNSIKVKPFLFFFIFFILTDDLDFEIKSIITPKNFYKYFIFYTFMLLCFYAEIIAQEKMTSNTF
jgi:hypothetical protein